MLIQLLLCSLPLSSLWSQIRKDEPSSSDPVYESEKLDFRYLPPYNMRDKTGRSAANLEDQAKALHIKSRAELLLSMSSGPDDKAAGWHSLTIVAYPRDAYGDLDDVRAEAKMNDWVGGSPASASVPARQVLISDQPFLVSVFAVQQGSVMKGAVVFTTIRKGKLLSFAFAANSPERLKELTDTMKSVQFF